MSAAEQFNSVNAKRGVAPAGTVNESVFEESVGDVKIPSMDDTFSFVSEDYRPIQSGLTRRLVHLLLKAVPFHVDAHPAFARKFQHSSGVKRSQISPMAANRSVKVLAPTFRRWAFSFENACSMGFRSGL